MALEKVLKKNNIKPGKVHHCPLSEGKSSAVQYDVLVCAQNFANMFEDAKAMGEFRGTDHIIASDLGRTLKLWFKFRTQDGVESVNAYGPLDATTGLIDGSDLNPLILESLEIADGSITSVKLADNAVEMAKIADGAVVAGKIAANAITAEKVAANAITADKVSTSAITADKIAANAITAGKLAAGSIAVGTAAIANGAIVRAMIGNAAIDSAKIADAAIGSAKISNTIQSDNFNVGYAGWRLRKDLGSIEVSQLTVYDGAGNVVLSSGGVPYTFVSGRPTSLSGINSVEGSKLSGIEVGATKGASFGVNIGGQITASNASTYIANAAIGSAQIGSIALLGTSNFSVKSSTAGARMEMDSRVIKIYDGATLRVQLGDLSL
jgi:galactitol-specific phosphotransferase system IIB component